MLRPAHALDEDLQVLQAAAADVGDCFVRAISGNQVSNVPCLSCCLLKRPSCFHHLDFKHIFFKTGEETLSDSNTVKRLVSPPKIIRGVPAITTTSAVVPTITNATGGGVGR